MARLMPGPRLSSCGSTCRYAAPGSDRVAFLDSDVLVKRDLSALFATDLGASRSAQFWTTTIQLFDGAASRSGATLQRWISGVSLPDNGAYFNAGMLLIDVAKWREQDLEAQSVGHLLRHGKHLPIADQDGLNQLLTGRWHSLDLCWNVQTVGRFPMPQLSAWGERDVHGIRPDEAGQPGILPLQRVQAIGPLGGQAVGRGPRGRAEVLAALADCGYFSTVGAMTKWLELHLRGVARSGLLRLRQLGRGQVRAACS